MQAARKENGAVMVEFALVLPYLLLIVFGFVYAGLAMNAKIDATQVTAEGARYIAVGENPGVAAGTTMPNWIRGRLDTQAVRTNATVCISYPNGTAVGQYVRVTFAYNRSLIPFLQNPGRLNRLNIPVASQATMRLETVPTAIPAGCSS